MMEPHSEGLSRARDDFGSAQGDGSDPVEQLARLLVGDGDPLELPPIADLLAAVSSLASGTRRKVLLPLSEAPEELALVRQGAEVRVSYYTTESAPEVHVHDRAVDLSQLLQTCADAALHGMHGDDDEATAIARRLAERARHMTVAPDPFAPLRCRRRRGGSAHPPEDAALAFGFSTVIPPLGMPAGGESSQADVHAMLFEGSLWTFVHGRRLTLCRRGSVMLPVQRMVCAVRALLDAWEAGRAANVWLRSADFHVGVRLSSGGEVALTLGSREHGSLTAAALDVPGAALPILRLASDLLRTLVSADRAQSRNLRVRALRDEVRTLRRSIRDRDQDASFINRDPDRLRLGAGRPRVETSEQPRPAPEPAKGSLRFSERWRFGVDGLDATSTFFCGDRLVIATPRHTVALSRDSGEVLWARHGEGTTAFMAGTTLLRLFPDGRLELCDVEDGEPYASTRIAPRVGGPASALLAGGDRLPPMAVLTEGSKRLVAIDLRNGEPRWRFTARTASTFRLGRAGRVLLAVCGDGSLQALDVTTGEVAWRFSGRRRFVLPPRVQGEVALAAAGEPSGRDGMLHAFDLYSGRPLWTRELDAAPTTAPSPAAGLAVVGLAGGALAAFDPSGGELRWMRQDPAPGGAQLAFDRQLVFNAPGGRLTALALQSGELRWERSLADPLADDVPRRLEPVLRGGALFVPAASVHIIRPSDGASVGSALPCDLVPDLIRVDERGWVYVAEESGQIAAYAPVPQLSLIRGGKS